MYAWLEHIILGIRVNIQRMTMKHVMPSGFVLALQIEQNTFLSMHDHDSVTLEWALALTKYLNVSLRTTRCRPADRL